MKQRQKCDREEEEKRQSNEDTEGNIAKERD